MTYKNSQKNEIYIMELCLCAFGSSHFSVGSFCTLYASLTRLYRVFISENAENLTEESNYEYDDNDNEGVLPTHLVEPITHAYT